MENSTPTVFGKAGLRGRLASGPLAENEPDQRIVIELADGQKVQVPAAMLVRQPDGGYYLPISPADIQNSQAESAEHASRHSDTVIVPVIQEELTVEKRVVEHGRFRINKQVQEHEEVVDEPLWRDDVDIQHVPVNQPWSGPPPAMRYEGETLILPLLEEVLVIEKRLMFKEELHIRRIQKTVHEPQTVVLRSEDVTVEHVSPDGVPEARDGIRS